jgi:hypothetical protein
MDKTNLSRPQSAIESFRELSNQIIGCPKPIVPHGLNNCRNEKSFGLNGISERIESISARIARCLSTFNLNIRSTTSCAGDSVRSTPQRPKNHLNHRRSMAD